MEVSIPYVNLAEADTPTKGDGGMDPRFLPEDAHTVMNDRPSIYRKPARSCEHTPNECSRDRGSGSILKQSARASEAQSSHADPGNEMLQQSMRTKESSAVSSPPLLTVAGAAIRASVCEETVRRAYHSGHLRKLRCGVRSVRIRDCDLEEWIQLGMQTRRSIRESADRSDG